MTAIETAKPPVDFIDRDWEDCKARLDDERALQGKIDAYLDALHEDASSKDETREVLVEALRPLTYPALRCFMSWLYLHANIRMEIEEGIGQAWLFLYNRVENLDQQSSNAKTVKKKLLSYIISSLKNYSRRNSWNIYVPSSTKSDRLAKDKEPRSDLINRGDVYLSDRELRKCAGSRGWRGVDYWNGEFYGDEDSPSPSNQWSSDSWSGKCSSLDSLELSVMVDMICENEEERAFLVLAYHVDHYR